MRATFAKWLRRVADRVSPETAFRATGFRLRLDQEGRLGWQLVAQSERGFRLWYRTQDYDQGFE